ncbi:MAG: hypothetical protein LBD51_04540 [Bifidobacteriaceae bacterium]|jgi:hypothetical protein|nr:hypothetical protein [Bifidobacteriaceae bacterium]
MGPRPLHGDSPAYSTPAAPGTPPNYSSGMVTIAEMNKAAVLVAITSVVAVAANMVFWGSLMLGL